MFLLKLSLAIDCRWLNRWLVDKWTIRIIDSMIIWCNHISVKYNQCYQSYHSTYLFHSFDYQRFVADTRWWYWWPPITNIAYSIYTLDCVNIIYLPFNWWFIQCSQFTLNTRTTSRQTNWWLFRVNYLMNN